MRNVNENMCSHTSIHQTHCHMPPQQSTKPQTPPSPLSWIQRLYLSYHGRSVSIVFLFNAWRIIHYVRQYFHILHISRRIRWQTHSPVELIKHSDCQPADETVSDHFQIISEPRHESQRQFHWPTRRSIEALVVSVAWGMHRQPDGNYSLSRQVCFPICACEWKWGRNGIAIPRVSNSSARHNTHTSEQQVARRLRRRVLFSEMILHNKDQ